MDIKRNKIWYEIYVIGGIFRVKSIQRGLQWSIQDLRTVVISAHERPHLYKKSIIKSKPIALFAIYFIYFVI